MAPLPSDSESRLCQHGDMCGKQYLIWGCFITPPRCHARSIKLPLCTRPASRLYPMLYDLRENLPFLSSCLYLILVAEQKPSAFRKAWYKMTCWNCMKGQPRQGILHDLLRSSYFFNEISHQKRATDFQGKRVAPYLLFVIMGQ